MSLQKPVFNKFFLNLATGFGVGKLKPAPGTWGTLAMLPIAVGLMFYPGLHMFVCLFGFWVAIQSAQSYLNQFPEGDQDPSEVVVDEMIGILISLVWLPLSLWNIGIGFIVFRLLDVIKPFPISWFDKKGKVGIGIVADDVVAGIITNIFLHYLLSQGWLP